MKLLKVTQTGKLHYFCAQACQLQVLENRHYRWLSFADIVQSLMLKRKPWQLTLPHQYAMMLPLHFFYPQRVLELGLGGGNFARFILHWAAVNQARVLYHSVEKYSQVIHCFNQYFNPEQLPLNIKQQSVNDVISSSLMAEQWLICDVFQLIKGELQQPVDSLNQTSWLDNIQSNQLVSINLPIVTAVELQQFFTRLLRTKLVNSHKLHCFELPAYRNIVLHLVPKTMLTTCKSQELSSYLPASMQHRFAHFWRQGKVVF